MATDVKKLVADRVTRAENPEWYLRLLGLAIEEVGSDMPRALAIADRAIKEHPHPPATDHDRVWQSVADGSALDDYMAGHGGDAGAEKHEEQDEPAAEVPAAAPFHERGYTTGWGYTIRGEVR